MTLLEEGGRDITFNLCFRVSATNINLGLTIIGLMNLGPEPLRVDKPSSNLKGT